jgi:hypothetical protein
MRAEITETSVGRKLIITYTEQEVEKEVTLAFRKDGEVLRLICTPEVLDDIVDLINRLGGEE